MTHLPVVLLAGGLGTRVSNISAGKPKALLPLAGKPFIHWKLEELIAQGITKIYFLLGYGADQIEKYLIQTKYPVEIVIIRDQPKCTGTGRALSDAMPNIVENQFILTYGDNLLPLPISEFTGLLQENHCRMVITSRIGPADKPNAAVEAGLVTAYGKINSSQYTMLDYGYSVISKSCLKEFLQEGIADLAPAFTRMAQQDCLEAHITDYGYTEIGTPETYFQANESLGNNIQ